MTVKSRSLSHDETQALALPGGSCCCRNHGHEWYERTDTYGSWYECRQCAEVIHGVCIHCSTPDPHSGASA